MILPITGKVGDFVDGEVVTGQTSGAKGIVATHFLRCQNQVNPSGVAVPVKFKVVFEPAGVPSLEAGIALTGVEGTFQDGETVVGETSGATATMKAWQDYTLSREVGNNNIARHYDNAPTYAEAKAGYEGSPTWDILTKPDDLFLQWSAGKPVNYAIWANNTYISFNTTGISLVNTAQILLKHVSTTSLDRGSAVVYIYKHDFGDTLESGDWSGGILIAQRTFTPADNLQDITMDIDPYHVTLGGHSRYRFAWKRTVDLDYWNEGEIPNADDWLYADYVKLKLSAI